MKRSSKRFTSRSEFSVTSRLAAPVELFQDGGEVPDVELDLLLRNDLRNALQCELIVGVEGQFRYFQPALLLLDMVNLLVYLDKYGVVVQFLLVILDNQQGAFLFPFAGRLVPGKVPRGNGTVGAV